MYLKKGQTLEEFRKAESARVAKYRYPPFVFLLPKALLHAAQVECKRRGYILKNKLRFELERVALEGAAQHIKRLQIDITQPVYIPKAERVKFPGWVDVPTYRAAKVEIERHGLSLGNYVCYLLQDFVRSGPAVRRRILKASKDPRADRRGLLGANTLFHSQVHKVE